MRVLFDQGTPRNYLITHQVITTFELGWDTLTNGELLRQAEMADFNVLITTDQNLKYQQNLSRRKIAIVVLTTTSWPRIEKVATAVVKAVDSVGSSGYVEIPIP